MIMREARKKREEDGSQLSEAKMIRIAASEVLGFCQTKEIKAFVKGRWGVEVSSDQIWNQLGNQRTRILNSVNTEQRRKARDLLVSTYGDERVAIQLVKLAGIDDEKL